MKPHIRPYGMWGYWVCELLDLRGRNYTFGYVAETPSAAYEGWKKYA
jgi:hypothetical protein